MFVHSGCDSGTKQRQAVGTLTGWFVDQSFPTERTYKDRFSNVNLASDDIISQINSSSRPNRGKA